LTDGYDNNTPIDNINEEDLDADHDDAPLHLRAVDDIIEFSFCFCGGASQKKYQKKLQQKEKIEKKETSDNKEGALCVFSFCFCGGAL
jgi:hypothetical protein